MALGPLLAVTVTASNIAACREAYARYLGWQQMADGVLTTPEAEAWDAPTLAGHPWAYLTPSSGRGGGIRFVEDRSCRAPPPLRTLGWAAAELSVRDVPTLAQRLQRSPFKTLDNPRPLGSNPRILAMQVVGPAGEVLYLTDVRAYDGKMQLLRAQDDVDGVFIAVLASANLPAARSFYETGDATTRVTDHEVAIPVLNAASELPADTRHRISSLQLRGTSLIEIDQYPAKARPRPLSPASTPQGITLITLAVSGAPQHWHPGAGQHTHTSTALPYDGRPARILRGAAGELIELVCIQAAEP